MGTDHYHGSAQEPSREVWAVARMCASLAGEAEPIGRYLQCIAVEKDVA